MKTRCLWLAAALLTLSTCFSPIATAQESSELIGAWDVTVTEGDQTYPSWFEVRKSGRATLIGRYVGQFGSARPISEVTFENGELRFEVPPQWEDRKTHVVYEGKLNGKTMEGVTTDAEGNTIHWKATRAPELAVLVYILGSA